MLTKKHRLTGKQINWLMGRGRKLRGKQFGYVIFPQRAFIKQTQRSITIPVKLDKRATMRNLLKRHAKQVFMELWTGATPPTHRQCFVYLNKKTLDDLKQRIATHDKKAILEYWIPACRQDFSLFIRQLCQPVSQKPSGMHGKK